MNNLTALPMDITQLADTKVISDSEFSGSKEKSDSFLALIEQHSSLDKSGNKQKNSGNKEYSKEELPHQDKIEETKSTSEVEKPVDEVTVDNEPKSEGAVSDNEEISSDAKALETTSPTVSEDEAESQNDPEDLLSFISASDKMSITLADHNGKNLSETKIKVDEKTALHNFQTEIDGSEDVDIQSDEEIIARSLSKNTDATEVKAKVVDESKLSQDSEKAKFTLNQFEQKNDAELSKNQEDSSSQAIKSHSAISMLAGDVEAAQRLSSEQSSKINGKYIEANGILSKTSEHVAVDDLVTAESDALTLEDIINSEEITLGTQTDKLTTASSNPKTSELTNNVTLGSSNKAAINSVELDDGVKQQVEELDIAESIVFTDKPAQSILLDKNTINYFTQDGKSVGQLSKDSQKFEVNTSHDNDPQSDSQNKSSEESVDLANNTTSTANNKPAVTHLFDNLSQREASQSIQRAEEISQREQSFENVMSTMSSEITQTQKNTAVQQAEVISLMRKDATDALKEKVMVMINQKLQQVDIQLDPPELGSMQVRINMQNEQAVVNFVVQNQQAKEALDQNLDKLKNMMTDNGVDVGEANIEQQSNQSSNNEDEKESMNGEQGSLAENDIDQQIDVNSLNMIKASSTGVDYYA